MKYGKNIMIAVSCKSMINVNKNTCNLIQDYLSPLLEEINSFKKEINLLTINIIILSLNFAITPGSTGQSPGLFHVYFHILINNDYIT